MSSKAAELKQITLTVRALVTSEKSPCFLRNITRAYPGVEGKPIPFRTLGYNSAEELLRETGEFTFSKVGNEICIAAKSNNKSAHIQNMVRAQRPSKTKQARPPVRSDLSWNKSSYSSNVYVNLPRRRTGSGNTVRRNVRDLLNPRMQQSRQTNTTVATAKQDFRQIPNTKKTQSQSQQQQKKIVNGTVTTINERMRQPLQQQRQPLQQQKQLLQQQKQPLQQHKQPLQQQKPTLQAQTQTQKSTKLTEQPEKQDSKTQKETLPSQKQPVQQQKTGSQPKKQPMEPQKVTQQPQNEQSMYQQNQTVSALTHPMLVQKQQKRPILGQNNSNVVVSSTDAAMELLRNENAIAIASTMILAQRAQQEKYFLECQLEHQKQRLPHMQHKTFQSIGNNIQNRLKIRVNSAGTTPDTTPSPILSAGTEVKQNPFAAKQGIANKTPLLRPQPQLEMQPIIPPVMFQFNPTLDPITSLSQYCVVRGYTPPKYTSMKCKFSKLYQCRVEIEGSLYSTYPHEYLNDHMAKIACAQLAIEKIQVEESKRTLPAYSDSDEELVDRLYEEVIKHPNGIIDKNVPEWFETTFGESLPLHWFSLVEKSKRLTYEHAPNGLFIIFAKNDFETDDLEESVITVQMEAIKLPWHRRHWQILITYCASTIEVWGRLFGKEYGDRFNNLSIEIEAYMRNEKARPLSLAAKHIYLVSMVDCWHRVRVEELDKTNGTALCFFIDFGDTDWIDVSQLYICDPKFLILPAQSVPFSLFGLEDFAGTQCAQIHLTNNLSNKSLVGEILTKEADFYAENSNTSGKIQVVLYDTSTADDINLNPTLLDIICDDIPPPELKTPGVSNVVVPHITDDGYLYLRVFNSDFKYVQKLIGQLIESKFKRDQHAITRDDLKTSNMFLICEEYNSNGMVEKASSLNWCRGALIDTNFTDDDEDFNIFFVDIGKIRRVHISKIFRLESLSMALSKYPRQAIKVRLHNIPETTKIIVGRMRALLPRECDAMVKVVVPGDIPMVTIFKRDKEIISTINDVLRLEYELNCDNINGTDASSDSSTENGSVASSSTNISDLVRGLSYTSMPSSPHKGSNISKLRMYEPLPQVGDYVEVRVTMSANPSNFMIQPYQDYPLLRNLMKELQEYCENNDEFIPADMVEIGQAYAAKNPDGFYHRLTVVNTYNREMIHVCFCDFGDIAILRSDQLKILPAKFRQLPKMAIQAKLHDVAALHVDWTLEDCVRFRALTVGKKFFGYIRKTTYDELTTPPTPILELELIDVSTQEDILIHEILLDEGRAIRECVN